MSEPDASRLLHPATGHDPHAPPVADPDLSPEPIMSCHPESRLFEREQQYRAIFEATSDGLIINAVY